MPSKGKLNAGYLELGARCVYCDRPRNKGDHERCSKARQREHAQRNEP
jgi:hypothetical protein